MCECGRALDQGIDIHCGPLGRDYKDGPRMDLVFQTVPFRLRGEDVSVGRLLVLRMGLADFFHRWIMIARVLLLFPKNATAN